MQPTYPNDVYSIHVKTHLDLVEKQCHAELGRLRKRLEGNPEKLKQVEREFLIREINKLSTLGKLQAKLNRYRERVSKQNIGTRMLETNRSNNSTKLGSHLRAVGHFRFNSKWVAHHLICSKHPTHSSNRLLLLAYFGINDPHNGSWLPSKHADAKHSNFPHAVGHDYIHTDSYAEWIDNQLANVNSETSLIDALRGIRLQLLNAKLYPSLINTLTVDGKKDLGVY